MKLCKQGEKYRFLLGPTGFQTTRELASSEEHSRDLWDQELHLVGTKQPFLFLAPCVQCVWHACGKVFYPTLPNRNSNKGHLSLSNSVWDWWGQWYPTASFLVQSQIKTTPCFSPMIRRKQRREPALCSDRPREDSMAKYNKILSGKVSHALAQAWSRDLQLRRNQITTQRPWVQFSTGSAWAWRFPKSCCLQLQASFTLSHKQILRELIHVGPCTGGVTGIPL